MLVSGVQYKKHPTVSHLVCGWAVSPHMPNHKLNTRGKDHANN